MKSICLVVQSFYDMDIRVRRKAEALRDSGYHVDVLALRLQKSQAKSYVLEGVNVTTCPVGKKRGSKFRYLYEYLAFFCWTFMTLRRLCRTRQYAVVDVNTLPDFLIFAAGPARWRGAKLVLDMHEITPEFYMSKYGIKDTALLIRLLKWVEAKSFKYADHVLTINHPIEALMVERGLPRSRSTIIMNSVDEAFFAQSPGSPDKVSDKTRNPTFVMMYHGTLTRLYGLDLGIEAFAQAEKDMPGAEYWILGDGPERPRLQALAAQLGVADKVRFVGSVRPEEIPHWLMQCHAGVLSTRRDIFLDYSFSNKLSEYIVMRKAVICSRLKAIRHYFSEEALAFFEPNNPADLARQMVHLYQDAPGRARRAKAAFDEYQPIRWEVMKQRYLDLIGTLANPIGGAAKTSPLSHSGRDSMNSNTCCK